jgi:hypothetical protein
MRNVRRKTYLWLRELAGNDAEMFAPHGVPVQIPKHADLSIRYLIACCVQWCPSDPVLTSRAPAAICD